MITLRPYQQKAIEEIRTALSQYKKVLFQAPTAYGKSLTFSYIAMQSQKFNRKVLILSSRTEILLQNGGALEKFGLQITYISPKFRGVPKVNIVVGMAQTLKRRIEKPEWTEYLQSIDLLIIDESHECITDFIHDYISDKCFVLAVTATPRRYGKMKQLGSMYKAMVQSITIQELIDMGYLSKSTHYSITAPKLDIPIDKSIGDYNQKALAQQFENKTLYSGVVSEYLRLTPHKKTICFCVSSTQAIELTKEFVANGVSAQYLLSGNFEDDAEYSGDRTDVIDSFKRSEFEVLINVGVLVAGFDCPDVEVIIANYSTISITKWKQSLGRGARVTDNKKEFTILDCGANYKKLGMYADEPTWCLWHDCNSGEGVQNTKECDTKKADINGQIGCGQLVPSSCKVCPACGRTFINEKHEYLLYLEEVSKQEEETIASFCAKKKLEGWSTHRIFVQVLLSNTDNEKKAFMEACAALKISEKYYYPFMKNVWSKIKHKRI